MAVLQSHWRKPARDLGTGPAKGGEWSCGACVSTEEQVNKDQDVTVIALEGLTPCGLKLGV